MNSPRHPITPDLETLSGLFFTSVDELGDFSEVAADDMPDDYRRLLAHTEHMTVTVEQFHGGPVDVRVLDKLLTPTHYARKIVLVDRRKASPGAGGRVVQFGIMRVNLSYLPSQVRDEIRGEVAPLGRILIRHNVLTRVNLFSLWKITTGDELTRLFELREPGVTYGRTATIEVEHRPAVELLEIVTPL